MIVDEPLELPKHDGALVAVWLPVEAHIVGVPFNGNEKVAVVVCDNVRPVPPTGFIVVYAANGVSKPNGYQLTIVLVEPLALVGCNHKFALLLVVKGTVLVKR